ncbi:hypothetical protein ACFX13_012799 [Malus domestica]
MEIKKQLERLVKAIVDEGGSHDSCFLLGFIFLMIVDPTLLAKDCIDLVRQIVLLTHLFEERRVFKGSEFRPLDASTSSTNFGSMESWVSDLMVALQATKSLVLLAANFTSNFASPPVLANHNDEASEKISFQFQCVTWKLEKALGDIPYNQFDISEEVEEQESFRRPEREL